MYTFWFWWHCQHQTAALAWSMKVYHLFISYVFLLLRRPLKLCCSESTTCLLFRAFLMKGAPRLMSCLSDLLLVVAWVMLKLTLTLSRVWQFCYWMTILNKQQRANHVWIPFVLEYYKEWHLLCKAYPSDFWLLQGIVSIVYNVCFYPHPVRNTSSLLCSECLQAISTIPSPSPLIFLCVLSFWHPCLAPTWGK